MKILIDIGNTACKFGTLSHSFSFLSRCFNNELNEQKLDEILSNIINIDNIYVSSVVPKITKQIKEYFIAKYAKEIVLISIKEISDLKIQIDNPNELGLDLYCDMLGAINKYQSPSIVVDMGTATKILLINKDHIFNTCVIMLGMQISKKILNSETALLPLASGNKVVNITEARDTIDVINSSTYFAQVEMINGLIKRIEKEIGYSCLHIFTGGNASEILKDLDASYIFDEYLCLEGLSIFVKEELQNEKNNL